MSKLYNGILIVACACALVFVVPFNTHAKPPKPGPNFVWVKPHTAPDGTSIPGHWKYAGPKVKGKTWVPGHYRPNGSWKPGHWKKLVPPKQGRVWVPGHRGPKGRWIPGHWK